MQTGDGIVYREYLYLKLCSDAILQYVDVSALLFSGWFFTCKPRPAVQEYGEGEHDLYGGDAQVSGWPTL